MGAMMANPYDDIVNNVISGGQVSSPYDDAWSKTNKPEQADKKSRKNNLPELNVDPTSGMTEYEKFMAGVGKSFVDLARGVGQYTPFVSRKDVEESRKSDAALM